MGNLLREAKIFAAQKNLRDLEEWIDDELSGYASGRKLAEYREVAGTPSYSEEWTHLGKASGGEP